MSTQFDSFIYCDFEFAKCIFLNINIKSQMILSFIKWNNLIFSKRNIWPIENTFRKYLEDLNF